MKTVSTEDTPVTEENKRDSLQRTGWALLKTVLKTMESFSEAFPPLKISVSAVLKVMDAVDVRFSFTSFTRVGLK